MFCHSTTELLPLSNSMLPFLDNLYTPGLAAAPLGGDTPPQSFPGRFAEERFMVSARSAFKPYRRPSVAHASGPQLKAPESPTPRHRVKKRPPRPQHSVPRQLATRQTATLDYALLKKLPFPAAEFYHFDSDLAATILQRIQNKQEFQPFHAPRLSYLVYPPSDPTRYKIADVNVPITALSPYLTHNARAWHYTKSPPLLYEHVHARAPLSLGEKLILGDFNSIAIANRYIMKRQKRALQNGQQGQSPINMRYTLRSLLMHVLPLTWQTIVRNFTPQHPVALQLCAHLPTNQMRNAALREWRLKIFLAHLPDTLTPLYNAMLGAQEGQVSPAGVYYLAKL